MTSSPPTPNTETRAQPASAPSVPLFWWREWLKPIVVVAVISVLIGSVTLVANVWAAAFQSLKADIRDGNAQLHEEIRASNAQLREEIRISNAQLHEEIRGVREEIRDVREEIKASEARLREEVKASEARQRQDLREVRAELKVDNQVLAERLDQVLESSTAAKPE